MTSGDAGTSCAQMLSSGTDFQPRDVNVSIVAACGALPAPM